MAYSARKRGGRLTVFAAISANPLKVSRMRALGATVVLEGRDFDAAKESGKRHAETTGALWVEDGAAPEIAEGAGTIALELDRMSEKLHAVFVPLGNGALVNGIGTWVKRFSPATSVIAVCAAGAPAMQLSWLARKAVSTPIIDTIADGIGVRVPVPEAVAEMRNAVDDVILVTDEDLIAAMWMLQADAGLLVEPAGAAGVAAVVKRQKDLAGKRVAVVLTGGNITEDQIRQWLS
jgi:threonine dehydratase